MKTVSVVAGIPPAAVLWSHTFTLQHQSLEIPGDNLSIPNFYNFAIS